MPLAKKIKAEALRLGFDACGIAKAQPLHLETQQLQQWIAAGRHGEMHFLERHLNLRANPEELLPGCKSLIMVLINYKPEQLQDTHAPQVAKYAYGLDYHYVMREKLELLLHFLQKEIPDVQGRAFVDSAPIMERAWAVRAGLGFIGKNNMLIHPKLGSYTFIGALPITLELPPDTPLQQSCGNCNACIEHCPTKALIGANNFNASQCLSYLTIEHRGEINSKFKPYLKNRLFGCDNCLDVCPWNKKAPNGNSELLKSDSFLLHYNWEHFSRSDFKQLFKSSPLQRAGYAKLRERLKEIKNNFTEF